MKGDKGNCEKVKILNDRNFDLKQKENFLDRLMEISKFVVLKFSEHTRICDYLQNWMYIERYSHDSRLPIEKEDCFLDLSFDEFLVI